MTWLLRTFRLLAYALVAAGFAVTVPQTARAQVDLPLDFLAGGLAYTEGDDPDVALDRLDELLERLSHDGETDPRIIHDITRMQIDVLLAAGRDAEAGYLLMSLADFVSGERERLGIDPAPILSEAAAVFLRADLPMDAEASLQALLDEQRDGGLPGAALADTFTRLADVADLSGDAAGAQGYRQSAVDVVAPDVAAAAASRGDSDHTAVDVYYATDRARTTYTLPSEIYGPDRGVALEYGVATVTIPKTHRPGAIDKPSIWRAEFSVSPAKHIVLKAITPMPEDGFFSTLHDAVDAHAHKQAFVFIHGYNVTFDMAAKRAAQMAYDMNFAGVPILYSWPSRGLTMGYIRDTAVVRLSGRRLSRFLDDLVERSGAETIHIVAHSMGNRALTDALELMALRRRIDPGDPPIFDQVVFAAPDVDAGLFAAMMPTIRPIAKRLTLYASEQDWALYASRKLHGDAPRAGQAGDDVLVAKEFDSVDMSLLGEDMLSHSYYSSALLDLFTLFWRDADPVQRCGIEAAPVSDGAVAWAYNPDECSNNSLLDVLSVLAEEEVLGPEQIQAAVAMTGVDQAVAAQMERIVAQMLAK